MDQKIANARTEADVQAIAGIMMNGLTWGEPPQPLAAYQAINADEGFEYDIRYPGEEYWDWRACTRVSRMHISDDDLRRAHAEAIEAYQEFQSRYGAKA